MNIISSRQSSEHKRHRLHSLNKSFKASTPPTRYCVQQFKSAVKGRPKDVEWLIQSGELARSMGLTFDETSSIVRSHYKKLRGNTRRSWIERGLRAGFEEAALVA